MILLTHICDKCHKATTDEVTLEPGKVEYVNMPQDWKDGICPQCIKVRSELEEHWKKEEQELFES